MYKNGMYDEDREKGRKVSIRVVRVSSKHINGTLCILDQVGTHIAMGRHLHLYVLVGHTIWAFHAPLRAGP